MFLSRHRTKILFLIFLFVLLYTLIHLHQSNKSSIPTVIGTVNYVNNKSIIEQIIVSTTTTTITTITTTTSTISTNNNNNNNNNNNINIMSSSHFLSYLSGFRQLIPNNLQSFPISSSSSSASIQSSLPTCSLSSSLGPVFVPLTIQQLNSTILHRYEKPRIGGIWYPLHCQSQQKVAILIPYRNREDNLNLFIHHMHYFLQQQQLDYGLFVIEQFDQKQFNRAKLFNIGFLISQMMHNYNCYVLHDVDKMPEDTRYLYHCNAQQPRQMPDLFRNAIWDFHKIYHGKRRPRQRYYNAHFYPDFFGGVSALSKEQYLTINGMTNNYWGWGAEDDELLCRLRAKGYKPMFTKDSLAKYVIVDHKPDAQYSHRQFPNCNKVAKYMNTDGLNNVVFELNSIQLYPLYTLIRVKL